MSSKEYFNEVAGAWDAMREEFFPESIRVTALDRAGVRAGETAADLGAGTGFITEELLRRGLRVIAVDQSPAMLEEMRKKFGAEAVHYQAGVAENLPLPNEAVDHAFANMYLHHVETPAAAIREMARITRPGGNVVITDVEEHQFEFLRTEHHDRWMGFRTEDIRRWFEEAGLHDITVAPANSTCNSMSQSGAEKAKVKIFIAVGRKLIPPSPFP